MKNIELFYDAEFGAANVRISKLCQINDEHQIDLPIIKINFALSFRFTAAIK